MSNKALEAFVPAIKGAIAEMNEAFDFDQLNAQAAKLGFTADGPSAPAFFAIVGALSARTQAWMMELKLTTKDCLRVFDAFLDSPADAKRALIGLAAERASEGEPMAEFAPCEVRASVEVLLLNGAVAGARVLYTGPTEGLDGALRGLFAMQATLVDQLLTQCDAAVKANADLDACDEDD